MITGAGNGTNGDTAHRGEGVLTDRVIGTYLHGPVLARNPALADHILQQVTGQTLAELDLPDQSALRHTYLGNTYLGHTSLRGRLAVSLGGWATGNLTGK